ncbi:hypothetical protein EJB05_53693, partial [Eragrostis curvula]
MEKPPATWIVFIVIIVNVSFYHDELKIAIRVHTSDGTIRGLVTSEEVSKVVRSLMQGEEGEELTRIVAQLSAGAKEAMEEGGSSCKAAKDMIDELCVKSQDGNLEASKEEKEYFQQNLIGGTMEE